MPPSEKELLERAVDGDTDALALLLERHGPLIRGKLAGEIPQHRQAVLSAEDVMQQTYIDACLDVTHFEPRGPGAFAAWLMTLAKRNLLDCLRMLEAEKRGRNRRRVALRSAEGSLTALHERLTHTRSSPSRHAARNEAQRCLRRAIEQLPPTYRRVVEMYDLEGQSVTAVATALKRRPGAIFMIRKRAHGCLRACMGTASLYLSDTA